MTRFSETFLAVIQSMQHLKYPVGPGTDAGRNENQLQILYASFPVTQLHENVSEGAREYKPRGTKKLIPATGTS